MLPKQQTPILIVGAGPTGLVLALALARRRIPIRIVSAALKNVVRSRKSEGASTLTQQLARQLYLTPEKTYTRKVKEILFALQIERYYTKEQIMEILRNQPDPEYGCRQLIDLARQNGGQDNITVILVNLDDPERGLDPGITTDRMPSTQA